MKHMKEKIFIIEDEIDIVHGIKLNLIDEGYEIEYALNGNEGLRKAREGKYDLILLDIMLPGMNGLEICKKLRENKIDIPILMLTARGEEVDRVVGLEIGADDYISKPFSIRELTARIKAHLRREKREKKDIPEKIEVGKVLVDFGHLMVTRNKKVTDLTFMEAEILKFLFSREGKVVSRDELLDKVWGYEKFPTTRTIDNHILKIRKKIEDEPNHPKYVLTIYGGGYRLVLD